MKLEFESLAELELIIAAMGYEKLGVRYERERANYEELAEALVRPQRIEPPVELNTLEEVQHFLGNESAPTDQPEAPKRKRRTKAEMEAARAAESAETGSETPQSTEQSNTASANPFEANAASPTTQTILNAPNQQAATLAGIAAMQTQSPFESNAPAGHSETIEAVAQSPVTPVASDAAGFIETRSLELLTSGADLTPIKHMHVCREFIAKHGQAKYLQGFMLAGLPATVGTYKAEQCARHQAALEFLNAN